MKPVLFNTEMVQAIIAGKKNQTRRIVKNDKPPFYQFKPPFYPFDILYIRETWAPVCDGSYLYRADPIYDNCSASDFTFDWHPAIFMPKTAARIFLEVDEIHKETLQDITEADAKAEGVEPYHPFNLKQMPLSLAAHFPNGGLGIKKSYRVGFFKMWQSIYEKKDYDWNYNPDVWVIKFHVFQIKDNDTK